LKLIALKCFALEHFFLIFTCMMKQKRKSPNYWTKERCREEALKYKTRKEFSESSGSAARKAMKNGWQDDVCSHMIRLRPVSVHWTKETCHQEALKYNSRSEFSLNSHGAYNWSLRKGILDQICTHIIELHKPSGYWTKERCHSTALKYKTKNELHQNEKSAYWSAKQNGWYEEICSHMVSRNWTIEKCQEEALKYNTRVDFVKGCHRAYDYAQKNNLLDVVCSHMTEGNKPLNYWTKERCYEEALKCKTRKEFYQNHSSAYSSASLNGWLDEITTHFKRIGNWVFRCVYVYEFPDNFAYVGLTYDIKRRNLIRKSNEKDGVTKHIKETNLQPVIKQLTEYIPIDNAVILEREYIKKYRENGWNMLNIKRGGETGGGLMIWTLEMCKLEALKYNSRMEFYKKSPKAYGATCKHGWLVEVCAHMTGGKLYYTTKERCKEKALLCKTRTEFIEKYSGAYRAAKKNGWLDDMFSHISIEWHKPNNYWIKEKCQEAALKCKTKKEFKLCFNSAYNAAKRNGWLNEICTHMLTISLI
jgi:predicted GIY-YIG superfamily endonuclease